MIIFFFYLRHLEAGTKVISIWQPHEYTTLISKQVHVSTG